MRDNASKFMEIVKIFARANFVRTLRAHLLTNKADFCMQVALVYLNICLKFQ